VLWFLLSVFAQCFHFLWIVHTGTCFIQKMYAPPPLPFHKGTCFIQKIYAPSSSLVRKRRWHTFFKWNKCLWLSIVDCPFNVLQYEDSPVLLRRVIVLFQVEYFIKGFYAQFLLHFKFKFLRTLCMLDYYHMQICMSLWKFDQTMLRVIALFYLGYFIKNL
jgi:hypothetical protein